MKRTGNMYNTFYDECIPLYIFNLTYTSQLYNLKWISHPEKKL